MQKKIAKVKAEVAEGKKHVGQKTIFYDILMNDQIRPEDKTNLRFGQKGVAAG